MTSQSSRFQTEYVKSTEGTDPKVRVSVYLPALLLLKLLFFALMGQPQVIWHSLSESEIELLSKNIVKWRLVKNLRGYKSRAKHK